MLLEGIQPYSLKGLYFLEKGSLFFVFGHIYNQYGLQTNRHINNPFVGAFEMTFGLTKGKNLL